MDASAFAEEETERERERERVRERVCWVAKEEEGVRL